MAETPTPPAADAVPSAPPPADGHLDEFSEAEFVGLLLWTNVFCAFWAGVATEYTIQPPGEIRNAALDARYWGIFIEWLATLFAGVVALAIVAVSTRFRWSLRRRRFQRLGVQQIVFLMLCVAGAFWFSRSIAPSLTVSSDVAFKRFNIAATVVLMGFPPILLTADLLRCAIAEFRRRAARAPDSHAP